MSKGSYSLDTPADREDIAYNPRADAAFDDADFTEEKAGAVDVAQRGGSNLATGFDAQQEDNEAARSEETGKVPRSTSLHHLSARNISHLHV
ncbi:hypothetical protein DENSPDRAFT_832484 [Dentipellis sp. KUC8613]|nr:hypothetical protein DENSPDRAFT_832484 [Dentipellis sp. KUC8613]